MKILMWFLVAICGVLAWAYWRDQTSYAVLFLALGVTTFFLTRRMSRQEEEIDRLEAADREDARLGDLGDSPDAQ
jgi:membrane protein implicated in regulation of membrane protease activity